MHVGAVVDQDTCDSFVLIADRPHQGGVVRFHGRGVHVRAVRDQRLDDGHAAGVRRDHQRRQAARLSGVWVGPGREQLLDHRRVRVLAGLRQARDAVIVRRVHACAGAEQEVDGLEIVEMNGPDQCRHAVGARPGSRSRAERSRLPLGGRGGLRIDHDRLEGGQPAGIPFLAGAGLPAHVPAAAPDGGDRLSCVHRSLRLPFDHDDDERHPLYLAPAAGWGRGARPAHVAARIASSHSRPPAGAHPPAVQH